MELYKCMGKLQSADRLLARGSDFFRRESLSLSLFKVLRHLKKSNILILAEHRCDYRRYMIYIDKLMGSRGPIYSHRSTEMMRKTIQ